MGTTEETLLKPLAEQLYPVEIQGNTVSSLKASSDPKPIIECCYSRSKCSQTQQILHRKITPISNFFCIGKSKLAQMV
jgi:hypothetical protein